MGGEGGVSDSGHIKVPTIAIATGPIGVGQEMHPSVKRHGLPAVASQIVIGQWRQGGVQNLLVQLAIDN